MRVRSLIEALVLAVAAFGLNLLAPDDPGLLKAAVNPYLLAAFVVAALRGWTAGYLALAAGAALAYLAFEILPGAPPRFTITADWVATGPLADRRVPMLALTGVLGVLLFGLVHFAHARRERRLRREAAELGRERDVVDRQRTALLAATSELERRVSGQPDSLAYLHARWRELSSQNVEDTLLVVLDTVTELTGAERCSLWQLDAEAGELVVRVTAGWDAGDDAARRLPVAGSIEGWVLRNDRLFSAKHLARYDTLRRVDRGTAVYAAPLRAGTRAWGVIVIEDLPFERFNAHTEHLLLLVAAVAAAPLQQAIAYEAGLEPADRAGDTGYPRFEQLARVLPSEVACRAAEGGSLSVVLIEVVNYHRLASGAGPDRAADVVARVFRAAKEAAAGSVRCFHYKHEGQLAVICPDLDFDGAALLALDFLRWASETAWPDDIGEGRPEFRVGYSSLARGVEDADALLSMAENLLAMPQHAGPR